MPMTYLPPSLLGHPYVYFRVVYFICAVAAARAAAAVVVAAAAFSYTR